MELEFDKEMDAILRNARGGGFRPGSAAGGAHADADAIAAFAENALPQATKTAFIRHFADCDDCRGRLSRAISMPGEIAAEPSSVVSATAAAAPWYKGLFRTPGLAFAMGALVLVFSGVLAFLVVRNNETGNAIVSQQTDSEPKADGVFSSSAAANAVSSNTAIIQANSPSNANRAVIAPDATPGEKQATDPAKTTGITAKENAPAAREESGYALDGAGAGQPSQPSAPAPPVTVTTDVTVGEVEKKDEDKNAGAPLEDNASLAKRKMTENRRRDAPPPAAKSGPTRSGPLQNQTNQQNSNLYEMTVTRSVGGKKFTNRDGVWYDSAYRGQATTNYRRSSTDLKSLDSGLRSIANELGGTVVVVWKGKAYRIS